MDYRKHYRQWCEDAYFDAQTREELAAITDEEEIRDRFGAELAFGTGGLRGILGAGTNRMNRYTVRRATQGLANYILLQKKADAGVVIAHDSRRMSPEFTEEAACCLNANGIKTYVFDGLRPTPELSFAVRYLKAAAGIVITASHNPREYNGYKVYWEDGAQITPPHDKNIMAEVKKITDFSEVKTMEKAQAVLQGLYQRVPEEMDDWYIAQLKKQSIHPELIKKAAGGIKIVYTPLNGTGNVPVRRVLKELGFTQVFVVPEQEQPDGDFPTTPYPNPEDPNAWKLALRLAKEKDADLILATDPDADRLGIYAKDAKTGEYQSFTGNMSGVLIAEYILREKTKNQTMPKNPALVKTIVTTQMAVPICKKYGVTLIDVLTGFKFIGEQIRLFEENDTYQYVFGFEESYGCLTGTYARDKDACSAVMMLCEAAAYYKLQGKTLCDAMEALYQEFGYYQEGLATVTMQGLSGMEKIEQRMGELRENPPQEVGGYRVLAVRDYASGTRRDLVSNEEAAVSLPKSNVLYLELEREAWCCVRPSGTESKIKYYFGVKEASMEEAKARLKKIKVDLTTRG